MSFWDYLIPSVISAVISFLRDISNYLPPEDPSVWINAVVNMSSYITSALIIDYTINRNKKKGFMNEEAEILGEPVIHGLISSVILTTIHSYDIEEQLLTNNTYISNFENGAINNIFSKYLYMPFQ